MDRAQGSETQRCEAEETKIVLTRCQNDAIVHSDIVSILFKEKRSALGAVSVSGDRRGMKGDGRPNRTSADHTGVLAYSHWRLFVAKALERGAVRCQKDLRN